MSYSDLYAAFEKIVHTASGLPIQVKIIAGLITFLSLFFLWQYVVRGLYLSIKIRSLLKDLRKFKKEGKFDPSEIFTMARGKDVFHLWTEYRDTLHQQKKINPESGIEEVVSFRSTVPAETFFSTQALVDSRLNADFFRHLPGIFTGLGIIGTFSGLIKGLKAFNVSESTEIVRKSLESLLSGVSEAFIVSAIAIGLAMLVTLIEKSLLSSLHRKIEQLCYLIDSFFEAGAGEEYLERLVKASEDSSSRTVVLKDALMAELKQTMFELNQQQIKAFNEQIAIFAQASLTGQKDLGHEIVRSIEAGIAKPLAAISESFKLQRESSGEELSSALNDVLSSFTKGNQDLFGGQISGINELQQKTVAALESAVSQLNKMTTDVKNAGTGAADAMASKLTDAISALEARQLMMNAGMTEFVEQIKNLVSQSQTETAKKLQDLLYDLGNQVSLMVSELKSQSKEVSDFHSNRQNELSYATVNAITSVSSEMKNSLQSMQSQILQLLGVIEKQQDKFVDKTESAVANIAQRVEDTVSFSSGKTVEMIEKLSQMVETSNANTSTAVASIQIAVSDLSDITGSTVRDMNDGAKNLLMSAEEFGRASRGLTGILDKLASVSKEMSSSSLAANASARMLEAIATDFRTVSQSVAGMLGNLGSIVESARKEASLTEDVLTRIEGSAQKLFAAQHQADTYLSSVSDVLTQTHKDFTSNMRSTLKDVNNQFFDHLTTAVSRLREGIEELEATLGRIGSGVAMEI